jgi:hypothetical protein
MPVPPAPVLVLSQRPLAPRVTSVMSVANDKKYLVSPLKANQLHPFIIFIEQNAFKPQDG